MKKVSLLAIALSLGTAASAEMSSTAIMGGCPQAFKGFHLLGDLGYGVGVDKLRQHDSRGHSSSHMGVRGIIGGIGTGYTHRFCNWALGLNFDAKWSNADGRIAHVATTRLKNSLQLYARTGYVLHEQIMPFLGLGWDNSRWRNKFYSPTTAVSKTRHFNSLLWKFGVDFLLTKHVVTGFEYTGTSAKRKSFRVDNNHHASFRPQFNEFGWTVKIVY